MDLFRKKYPDFNIYQKSIHKIRDKFFFLASKEIKKFLVIGNFDFKLYPLNQKAINILCENFSFLKPKFCGMQNSFGFGDRTGLATPGHIKALKNYKFFPIFAQQSVREINRTGRNFSDVLNSAIIGVFQEGYKNSFGADADHIKDVKNLKKAINSGFTFFTIDPSDKIPEKLENQEIATEKWRKYEKLYLNKKIKILNKEFVFTEQQLRKIVLIYNEAIEFVEECYKHLKENIYEFDLEVSVDETSFSTTPIAHIFIVEEFHRRKIEFQNLALKFPGKFEKGIDYKGNLREFEERLIIHQKIREKFGSYKISFHSGSDKFKIYPIFKNILGDNFHVKTSGTSWIEAMRVIAEIDFDFFQRILILGIKDFKENSASYEISAKPENIDLKKIKNKSVNEIFNNKDIRQVIHISYNSVFSKFKKEFLTILRKNEKRYYQLLEKHFGEHLKLLT